MFSNLPLVFYMGMTSLIIWDDNVDFLKSTVLSLYNVGVICVFLQFWKYLNVNIVLPFCLFNF